MDNGRLIFILVSQSTLMMKLQFHFRTAELNEYIFLIIEKILCKLNKKTNNNS